MDWSDDGGWVSHVLKSSRALCTPSVGRHGRSAAREFSGHVSQDDARPLRIEAISKTPGNLLAVWLYGLGSIESTCCIA